MPLSPDSNQLELSGTTFVREEEEKPMKRARRDLLKRTAALSAAAGAAAFVHPSAIRSARAAMTIDKIKMALAKHKGEVLTLCTWGGTTADAFREAYFKPFSEEFGIEVVEDAPPTNAKIVAMVKSGYITWDLCDIGEIQELRASGPKATSRRWTTRSWTRPGCRGTHSKSGASASIAGRSCSTTTHRGLYGQQTLVYRACHSTSIASPASAVDAITR